MDLINEINTLSYIKTLSFTSDGLEVASFDRHDIDTLILLKNMQLTLTQEPKECKYDIFMKTPRVKQIFKNIGIHTDGSKPIIKR